MSTTTKNLGLLKPELTDAADITATNQNWDAVDEKIKAILQGKLEVALPTTMGGTGANSTEEGFRILFTRATINASNLVNANSLTTSGIHMVYIETVEPSTLNYPFRYGILFVVAFGGYVAQTFYSVSADNVYFRSSYNGSAWSEWQRTYTTKNKPSLTELGAASNDHNHDGRYYQVADVERGANMVLAAPNGTNGDATFRKLVADDLPTIPISKGGTGANTLNGAVANLLCRNAIGNDTIVDANTLIKTGIYKIYLTDENLAVRNNYPYVYGNMLVISNMEETNYAYIVQMFLTTNGIIYVRASTNSGSTWTTWAMLFGTNTTISASAIAAGTFAGQVVANSGGQGVGTSLLRNSKLVSTETNPTVNGEICWTYE